MVSPDTLSVLREMASAGFQRAQTMKLAATTGWTLTYEHPTIGCLWFSVPGTDGVAAHQLAVPQGGHRPQAHLTLFDFEDYDVGREPFDDAYRSILEELVSSIGSPSQAGSYSYAHQPAWPYRYAWWSLPDVTFALVQDEFDIQFGMDVSLWVLPARAPFEMPVKP